MRRLLFILTIGLLLFTCWSLWVTSEKINQQKSPEEASESVETQVGGDFALIDQNGRLVHAADLRGRVMLVFFGFTHCPDVCPIAVANLSKTMDVLGPQAGQVAALFITVDPERDTPAALKDYLSNFNKGMIGLTGTPEQIKQVTDAYKVYSAKTPIPASNGYNVDHSAFIYLMGKDGKFIRVFDNNTDAADMVRALKPVLE